MLSLGNRIYSPYLHSIYGALLMSLKQATGTPQYERVAQLLEFINSAWLWMSSKTCRVRKALQREFI